MSNWSRKFRVGKFLVTIVLLEPLRSEEIWNHFAVSDLYLAVWMWFFKLPAFSYAYIWQ